MITRSRRGARLAAAATLAGVLGALGLSAVLSPASADSQTSGTATGGSTAGADAQPASSAGVSFSSPSTAGATLSQSPVVLAGQVSQPGGYVDSITITVTWTDTAQRPPGSHPPQWVSENPDVRQSSVPWNYGPDVPYNGHYTVTVTASTDMGTGTAQQQVTANEPFVVNVPPTTPADVTAAPDPKQRVTDLRWSPNPEPDLIGYEVLRAGPSASDPGHVVGGVYTPATSYVDNQVATQPAGTYRYEVVAVRQNGAGNGVVLSGPSPETEVAFSTPPKVSAPPTTTTPAPGTSTSPKSAGTHGGSAGSAQPASGPRSRIVLAPVQSSLPDYQALLNQARATTVTVPPPDPGFSSRLPYQPQVNSKAITLPAIDSPAVLGAPEGGSSGARRTAEFVAAALLLAVLAMFALVLKRSAEQSLALEAVSPDGLPHGLPPEPTLLSPNPPRPEPSPPRPEPALTGRRTRGGSRWSDRVAAVSAGLAAEYTPRGRPAESAERADRAEPLPTSLMLTLRPVAPLPPELAGTPDGAPEP